MSFQVIYPPPQLADYVRFFWFFEGRGNPYQPYVHRILAEPCPEMIFYYKGQFRNYNLTFRKENPLVSGIYGQKQIFSQVEAKEDFGIFGVYLYPYALPQLFRLPAATLTNYFADFKTLCGKEGEMLEEQMMLAATNEHRITLASDFLTARLKNVKKEYAGIVSSIKEIANSSRLVSVDALAKECCLSVRQLERKIKELAGFNPKLFLQVVRFNAIAKNVFPHKSLTQIALECGYYDQAHFIHDFQKFSGYTPGEYFQHNKMAVDYRASKEFKK